MKRALPIALLLTAACNGASVTPLFVDIVTPSGANPLAADAGVTHVHIDYREGTTGPIATVDDDTSTPSYTRDRTIDDITALVSTRVTLTLAGGAGTLIGSVPDFIPEATTGTVRLPVGPPTTCAVINGLTFTTPRAQPTVVLLPGQTTYPILAGAPDPAAGGGDTIEVIDHLSLAPLVSTTAFDPLPISNARLVAVGVDAALAISNTMDGSASTYAVDPTDGTVTQNATMAPLHAGAVNGTAIVYDPSHSLVLGGGDDTSGPTDAITIVGASLSIDSTSQHLSQARRAPAALVLLVGSPPVVAGVLVAGGVEGSGAHVAEVLGLTGAPTVVPFMGPGPEDQVRRGGALFTDGSTAILVGGVDAAGAPVSTTVLITGCTSAGGCVAMAGPRFDDARAGATAVALPSATTAGATNGGLLVGGRLPDGSGASRLVTHVSFDAGTPRFTSSQLAFGRTAPAVYAIAGGLVFVIQGADDMGHGRTDVEVCFPDALTPIL